MSDAKPTKTAKTPAKKSVKKTPAKASSPAVKKPKVASKPKAAAKPKAPAKVAAAKKPVAVAAIPVTPVVEAKVVPVQRPIAALIPPRPAAAPASKASEKPTDYGSFIGAGFRKFKNWDVGIGTKVIIILIVIGIVASLIGHL